MYTNEDIERRKLEFKKAKEYWYDLGVQAEDEYDPIKRQEILVQQQKHYEAMMKNNADFEYKLKKEKAKLKGLEKDKLERIATILIFRHQSKEREIIYQEMLKCGKIADGINSIELPTNAHYEPPTKIYLDENVATDTIWRTVHERYGHKK